MTIAIDGRAGVREHIGGVERYAVEISRRLLQRSPGRYQLITPPPGFAHKAGHAWEQFVLPRRAASSAAIYCPANLAPVISRRAVTVIHDTAALSRPDAYSAAYVRYQRTMLPLIARRSRHLVTVSEFSKREIVEHLNVAPDKVTVIPGGVDDRFAQATPAASVVRAPYALAVGTESARKNHQVLTLVAAELATVGVRLVLAGGTREYLRSAQPPAQPADGIERIGYVPDEQLPALYAGARMLVMPSLYEGFGLPCIEAMAAGIPVLALASGAVPETCGDAAQLVDPANPGEFAATAVELTRDEQLRQSLITAGRRRAQEFSWDAAAARTDGLLGSLDT